MMILLLSLLIVASVGAEEPHVSGCGFGTFPPCIITEAKPDPIEVILVPSQCEQQMAVAMQAIKPYLRLGLRLEHAKHGTVDYAKRFAATLLWNQAEYTCVKARP